MENKISSALKSAGFNLTVWPVGRSLDGNARVWFNDSSIKNEVREVLESAGFTTPKEGFFWLAVA